MNPKKPKASTNRPRRVQRKLDSVVRNRFHIDVRSPTFAAGDMEWAKALFALNDFLPKIGLPHFEAHLEEYPTSGRGLRAKMEMRLNANKKPMGF